MQTLDIRPTTTDDLPAITEIYTILFVGSVRCV